jgi:methylthioribose-1-phosphate isomerase
MNLSHIVNWLPISTPEEAFDAIKTMKVRVSRETPSNVQIRGAPAIASLAALSIRSHLTSNTAPSFTDSNSVSNHLHPILDYLQSSRPTAVNLSEAMNRIRSLLSSSQGSEPQEIVEKVKTLCGEVHSEDVERCKEMGRRGAEWLWSKRGKEGKKGLKVLTVCNTGSLATSVSHIQPIAIVAHKLIRSRDMARLLE